MRRPIFILLPAFWALACQAAEPTKGVDLQLLSEVSTIQPGIPFTVGLHIHHHDGFHTYWQNPGIVGIPTQLDWNLPNGFSAGPIQWPTPEMVDMAGHPAHGFHRDVLLMVDITPPDDIDAKQITLQANATWMACARSCHPGTTELSLTLPVSNGISRTSSNAKLFKRSRRQLPKPLSSWDVSLLSPRNAPIIHLHLKPRAKSAKELPGLHFFSSDGQVSSDQAQQVTRTPSGSYDLVLKRAEFSPENSTHLPGILSAGEHFLAEGQRAVSINPRFPDKKTTPKP